MADKGEDGERKSAALRLAEEMQKRPFAAAAIAGGAAAAAAAGYMGARALARRNGACPERPLNDVLKTAITAAECNSAPVAADSKAPDPEIGMDGS
ncbi:MAG: hypothetical protein JOZ90_13430 [Alphaproteobacteria bacterium]|nr:hypothetical protein [Alphaproteobacteria bacterium]MBV9372885.1 hypothetical protein [Alphaproteobacteria bacterium]MBV9902073.1 hypothetical protein [Alphaproteobacteria bacterium]